MSDFFEELLENLERERRHSRSRSCLSDETLQALADQSLSTGEIEEARHHLNMCLPCLQAYAAFRGVLEGSAAADVVTETTVVRAKKQAHWRKQGLDGIRRSLAFRIPAGLSVAVTAAAVLLTWVFAGQMTRTATPFNPRAVEQSVQPAHLRGLSHKEANRPVSIAGTVEDLRPMSCDGADVYVVRLRAAGGAEYVVFTWDKPNVREGDRAEVEGVFVDITESGGPTTFKGVASQVRASGSK